MSERETVQYVIDPTQPFPKRWKDKLGPIRVMGAPHEGYIMVRRPRSMPFILSVKQLLNAEQSPYDGPFEIVSPSSPLHSKEEDSGKP